MRFARNDNVVNVIARSGATKQSPRQLGDCFPRALSSLRYARNDNVNEEIASLRSQ